MPTPLEIHPENSEVLKHPYVQIFQVQKLMLQSFNEHAVIERRSPVLRFNKSLPLSDGDYDLTTSSTTMFGRYQVLAGCYLSFRTARDLHDIPWGIYISHTEVNREAADLIATGLAPSDALYLARDIVKEAGRMHYEVDLVLLHLESQILQNCGPLVLEPSSTSQDAFGMRRHFFPSFCHYARKRVLARLRQEWPIHRAGIRSLEALIPDFDLLEENRFFDQIEDLMIRNSRKMREVADSDPLFLGEVRKLRARINLKKSPTGKQVPVFMTH